MSSLHGYNLTLDSTTPYPLLLGGDFGWVPLQAGGGRGWLRRALAFKKV